MCNLVGRDLHWEILGGNFLKYYMTERDRARVLCQVSQSNYVCINTRECCVYIRANVYIKLYIYMYLYAHRAA